MLLCLDIGNTHTHFGIVGPDGARAMSAVPTPRLDHAVDGLGPRLAALLADQPNLAGAAFCSVVPAAAPLLRRVLEAARFAPPVFQLTPAAALGIPIAYPHPAEIGQDRLANAAGAHALRGSPVIVIDLGTAVTFDIVTRRGGYEGGIIAPGAALMRKYLHEQTAQLPLLGDGPVAVTGAIGRSTVEAMQIGLKIGFAGLIQALLDATLAELAAAGEPVPALIATGGDAAWLTPRLRQTCTVVPDLTLRGLAVAWALNR
jgi:type III pantothenate kinase